MPELFIYLLKVNLAIILFYLVYHFLMRRLTFYSINRFYLLFAFLFSAIYPLVNVREWFVSEQEIPEVMYYMAPDWTVVESSSFSIWPYLIGLFWIVVLFFVGRLALRLLSLWQIHRASVPARWQYFHFRHVMQRINPFSFWKNIYVHVEAHEDHELLDIFNHEQVHVEQLHTVDTLIAEIYTVVCWFNPATWLMRYAVRENLEFITDRRVIRSGVDKRAYQYSLLNLGTTGSAPDELVSHFNLKHLKTRIMMMNKKKSSFAHLGKYVLAVPLIVLLALVFTISKAYVNAEKSEELSELEISLLDLLDENGEPLVDGPLQRIDTGSRRVLILTKSDQSGSPERRGVDSVLVDTRSQTLTLYRDGQKDTTIAMLDKHRPFAIGQRVDPLLVLNGKVIEGSSIYDMDPATIESVSVLKSQAAVSLYGPRGENGVVIVTSKSASGAAAEGKGIVTTIVEGKNIALAEREGATAAEGKRVAISVEGKEMTTVVDGQIITSTRRMISGDPVAVRVVKGEPMAQTIRIAGEPVKNVIRVEGMKAQVVGDTIYVEDARIYKSSRDSMVIHMSDGSEQLRLIGSRSENTPYVLIDGEEGDLSALDPERIKSIQVLKGGAEVVRQYGAAARNGVIKVETKK